jgi:hypothetical protein
LNPREADARAEEYREEGMPRLAVTLTAYARLRRMVDEWARADGQRLLDVNAHLRRMNEELPR